MAVEREDCGSPECDDPSRCRHCGRSCSPFTFCGASSSSSSFVGRVREIETLRAHLDAAAAGQGGIVAIVGEAGIGKTWLARELARYAGGRGATVLWGCSFEGDWQPAYGPWTEALGEYARLTDADLLRGQLAGLAATLAHLVPELNAVFPEQPEVSPLSPDHERTRLCDAVARLLDRMTERGSVLLVLDDLQWADSGSLNLLRYLSRFLARMRILVVAIHRDHEGGLDARHPLPGLLAVLRREAAFADVHLSGLDLEAVDEYAGKEVGRRLPRTLVRTIVGGTNGNPFYLRELLRHLTDGEQLLDADETRLARLSLADLGIPEGIRQIVARRLAGLSAETARLLRLASGFKAGFTFAAIQAVAEVPEEGALTCLDEALEAGFICVTETALPLYDFAHSIVRHAIYYEMNPDRRARLHRRIAVALEHLYEGRERRHAAELATHYHASRGMAGAEKGLPYALAAAEQAATVYAPEQAVEFLRMARDLAGESDAGQAADILCRLAVAEVGAVWLKDAVRTTGEALAALERADADPGESARLLATVANGLKRCGANAADWLPLVRRGLELVGDQRNLTWARLVLLEDRFEPVLHDGVKLGRWLGLDPRAVEVARTQGDEADYAVTLEPADWRSRAEADRVLALGRTWTHPEAVMHAIDVSARYLLYAEGAYEEAARRYGELLVAGRKYGSLTGQVEALMHLAISQAVMGRLAEARQTALEAGEVRARLGAAHAAHFLADGLATLLTYYLDGDWSPLARAAAAFVRGPDAARTVLGLFAVAMAAYTHCRAGASVEARVYLGALADVMPRFPLTEFGYATALATATAAAWDLPAPEHAPTLRRLAAEVSRLGFGDSLLGPHDLSLARLAALAGDGKAAAGHFDKARAWADARRHNPLLAIIDYDEVLASALSGGTAGVYLVERLETASRDFAKQGMHGWAARALARRDRFAASLPGQAVAAAKHPDGLTGREVEVLRLIAAGLTNKGIATELVLSLPTVERHIANLYRKIDARGRADATAYAMRHGLLEAGLS